MARARARSKTSSVITEGTILMPPTRLGLGLGLGLRLGLGLGLGPGPGLGLGLYPRQVLRMQPQCDLVHLLRLGLGLGLWLG